MDFKVTTIADVTADREICGMCLFKAFITKDYKKDAFWRITQLWIQTVRAWKFWVFQ